MIKQRETNYDLLRILACLSVIIIHVNLKYLLPYLESPPPEKISNITYLFLNIINCLTRFSVPCFFMLSGAFVLSKNIDNIGNFYKKNFFKLVVPYFVFIIVYFIHGAAVEYIEYSLLNESVDYISLLRGVLNGGIGNLWFMPVIISIYFFSPIIIKVKQEINPKYLEIFAYFFVFWAMCTKLTGVRKICWDISNCFSYMSYFILGNVIYNKLKNKPMQKRSYYFIICGFAASFSILMRVCFINNINYEIAYKASVWSDIMYFSPGIIIYSIMIFFIFGFINVKPGKIITELSKNTYMIYLTHTIILNTIMLLKKIFFKETFWIFPDIIILSLLTFILSLLLSNFIGKYFNKLQNHFMSTR